MPQPTINKKGTIIAFDQVPILKQIAEKLPNIIGEKGKNLVCEGNKYFNLKKCGIGWHGDKERRKVIAFRVGHPMQLCYNWYFRHRNIGNKLSLNLDHGDMYIMSEKAVGTDCTKSSNFTLRHSAGIEGSSYTKFKR